jgi:hypothetical protein
VKIVYSLGQLAVVLLVSVNVQAGSPKQLVGATEVVFIEEAGLRFKARVDTGAKTSSIHAENVSVSKSGDPIGKPISFHLLTKEGLSRKVDTQVVAFTKVRNSETTEQRYVVSLTIKWGDSRKKILVTLNDRAKMSYRLLLGRNWLHDDFIVDVDKNNED